MERLLFGILFLVSLFIIPPLLILPVVLVAMFFFPRFIEGVLGGIIIDSIFTSDVFFQIEWLFTLVLLISLVGIELVKHRMR